MCGIAGFTLPFGLDAAARARQYGEPLSAMKVSLRHRGPDGSGELLLDGVALAHTRLSIVDIEGGAQPMVDPRSGVAVVFNGEIFNHVELRGTLSGYAFRTRSDTEVIIAAYLRDGIACVDHFIGQFAFALWDPRIQELHLARDRAGVRPLYWCRRGDTLVFASEAKAIFGAGLLEPRLDPLGLLETVRLWSPLAPRTAFEGVSQLPPGHVACFKSGSFTVRRYWRLELSDDAIDHDMSLAKALERLEEVLTDAVRLRLRADVPVGAYLSGGLDSSLLCALAQRRLGGGLQTFSVGFAQARYDEQRFQTQVARALGTEHHVCAVADGDVGELLPQVVWHAEQVLLRTAPAPFLALSRLVREHGTKVVLTGEGADEVFLGYDLFKETQVRRFWSRAPASTARPRLLGRLYPYLPLAQQPVETLRAFFGLGLEEPDAFDFSHRIRWTNSGRIARFFAPELTKALGAYAPEETLAATLPEAFARYRPLRKAQLLEVETLLPGYLLSAQGDRMLMGNSVEGRFPFLDHRVMELSATVPDRLKLRGLDEKHLLKRFAAGRVPAEVLSRSKFPYRAPIARALTGPAAPEWARVELTKARAEAVGVFDGAKVEKLVKKLEASEVPSEADEMAVVAIASTHLLMSRFTGARS